MDAISINADMAYARLHQPQLKRCDAGNAEHQRVSLGIFDMTASEIYECGIVFDLAYFTRDGLCIMDSWVVAYATVGAKWSLEYSQPQLGKNRGIGCEILACRFFRANIY